MKNYRVIWFDDEHETRKKIREKAHLNDITLVGFSNAKEGIEELRKNIMMYDAALLDGIFYSTPDEKGTPTEDDAMGEVARALLRFESQKFLPWFILSGQSSFTKEKNRHAESFKNGQVFDKFGDDEHYSLLWDSIKAEADRQLDTKIRHKYSNIFDLCTDNYLGQKHDFRLLRVLTDLEQPELIVNSEDLLTPMRKIIEAVFTKFNEIGIIPDDIVNNPGWINGSSLFLNNKHNEYTHNEDFVPPVIAESIFRLLRITQDASHNEGSSLGVDSYVTSSTNNYLYQSSIYLLLDILDWSKNFMDQNSNKELNILKWKQHLKNESTPIFEGIIAQDDSGNFFCGQYLLNRKYVGGNNILGDRIAITESIENRIQYLKEAYPYFALKYTTIQN
ncbi:hypothetical protein VBZ51_08360 [Maribacter sp. HS]|uniref:hypothetical protein n=1 Tax=Maribacter sp. HS TaxID=3110480 RepID=UPI003A83B5B0